MQQIPPDEIKAVLPDHDAPEELEQGVWRIPLPLPFALRSMNAYLLTNVDEAVLVDCGLGIPECDAALRAGLLQAGISIERITTLVLTHAHPDHIGLAGPIHAASLAPVRMMGREAERMYGVWSDPEMRALRFTAQMFESNGMPAADLHDTARNDRRISRAIHLPPEGAMDPVEDGDVLRLAGADYHAIWTPGHADYHLCLLRDDGLFIAGDHILPRITPNIGLYPHSRPNPLRDYYASLARVRDLPVRRVLPGHGRPFADLATRVDELTAHHEDRASQILSLLGAHPTGADAYTLSSDLFGGRLRGPDDHRFALVESLAHLEDLRERGLVERREQDGHVSYVATATVPAE